MKKQDGYFSVFSIFKWVCCFRWILNLSQITSLSCHKILATRFLNRDFKALYIVYMLSLYECKTFWHWQSIVCVRNILTLEIQFYSVFDTILKHVIYFLKQHILE